MTPDAGCVGVCGVIKLERSFIPGTGSVKGCQDTVDVRRVCSGRIHHEDCGHVTPGVGVWSWVYSELEMLYRHMVWEVGHPGDCGLLIPDVDSERWCHSMGGVNMCRDLRVDM